MNRLNENMHPLLSKSAIFALFQQEIFTARDFILCDSQKLAKISLLVFKEILEIKKQLVTKYAAVSENGYDSYQYLLKNSALIPSGIRSIDTFLEGGLLTSNIYEICGKAASGKTLIAYTFMKNLVFEMKQVCFFLDTKNDFSAKKFSLLCREYSHDDILNGLKNIFIKHIETKFDLVNSLQEITCKLQNNFALRMVIIDSLSTVILNSKDSSQNNLVLSHLTNLMHFIASKYHVVFLVINLMTSWVEGDFSAQADVKTTISCGRFWYTVPNTRIKSEMGNNHIKLSIEKSNALPLGTANIPFQDIIPNDG